MIGHGKLAEKAMRSLMPSLKDFPYTIRVFCECTASNGSSSMASVCGASLALMDAGVPIKSPAAGVSIGLIYDKDKNSHILLTDLIGQEDHYGDMDFKIAGTHHGITAMQLDGKLDIGIPITILTEALQRAKIARLHILEKMSQVISKPRSDTKATAPQAELVPFHSDRKLLLIGRGGDVINFIRSTYDVEVEIFEKHQPAGSVDLMSSEKEDNCYAYIYGRNRANVTEAKMLVKDLVSTLREGDLYTSEVADVRDFGVIVKLTRAQNAVLHMSELSWDPSVAKSPMTSLFTIGQRIDVKVRSYQTV
jgi:polyribonucleotide nucleotidyltransferase